ncbi:rhomboid family intramembrane serine protease [Actinotalea fermentans]|uniref:rhomboid family intramembrane serine protease n=1 Tax=Actinotalea fermentans TaxID=43671 RepID=UPI00051F3B4C|nr:rhomboid family intramembrane serine protease [Actinotalea fermentans]KGM16117.1 protease [Actinotalea fermentans ATCC 43279 = JCM 9966 = DSM 3133]
MSTPDDALGPVDPIDRAEGSARPGGPADGPPVCPRHPDRVSYVRCQRCGRPTCPECQRPAAVGIHCVDCVRQAARTAPQRRTVFGAPVRDGAPVVTYTILGLTVASFLLQLALGRRYSDQLIFAPVVGDTEPYRFVTSALLHSTGGSFGLTHILFNMYALWILGPSLERAFGRLRFLALYLLSVVGGHVMVLLVASPLDLSWRQGVVGASGGIFGLFGAVLIAQRRIGGDLRGIAVILGLNLVITFLVPGISWQGHVGGLATGLALGAVYAYAPKERRIVLHAAGTAAVIVGLVALAVLKYSSF